MRQLFQITFKLYVWFLRTLTSLSLKVNFKKQPYQKIIASGKKDNQKLIQLIQKLFKSNDTITNSTTIPTCDKNCKIGMIKVVSDYILDVLET